MSTDNSDLEAKVLLREWLLQELGGAANCKVLELYGGLGHIYDACYTGVADHLAFELRKVPRKGWLQGDNRVLLTKYAKGWDLYDVDAYADPWRLAASVMRLTDQERFGVAITDGILRSLNTGVVNGFVRQRIGYNGMPPSGLLTRWYTDIVKWLIADWHRYGITVESARRIKSKNSHLVTYYGLIVHKNP